MDDKFRKSVLRTLDDYLADQLEFEDVDRPQSTADRLISIVDFALQADAYPYQDTSTVSDNAHVSIAFGRYQHPALEQHIGTDVEVFYGDDYHQRIWVKLPDGHFIVARSIR